MSVSVLERRDSSWQQAARRRLGWIARNAGGIVVALAIAAWLRLRPEFAATAATPRWAIAGTRVAEALTERWAALGALGWAGLSALTFYLSAPLLGAILAVPAVAWLAFRRWWAVYPRTLRGRVRAYGIDGFAGFWELRRHLSAHAVREVAKVTRPSLAERLPAAAAARHEVQGVGRGVAAARRMRRELAATSIPATECGTFLGRSIPGPVRGTACYAAHRDVVGIYGVQQSGKGAWFGGAIIDHCGAIVATSTKLDLYLATALLRGTGGRPVWLYNPDGLGGLASSLRWNPLDGCRDARTARMRARHHVVGISTGEGGRGEDSADWDEWAIGVLAALLMTAARSGRTMADVAHWVFTQEQGAIDAHNLLGEAFDGRPPQLVVDAMAQIVTTEAKRTRDSIFLILRNAVSYMADDTVAATCLPDPDEAAFDVAGFIAASGALYVIADKTSTSAPLRAALLGHVFETAKTLSADYPMERLDPPLAMALDEIALNPVPLDEWLPDAGGRGIHMKWAVQSPSQLAAVWGEHGAKVIRDCTNVLMVYGGLKDPDDLRHVSDLCDTRLEPVSEAGGGSESSTARMERVPVVTPAGVRMLVELCPLVIQRSSRPTMVRVVPYWERADVKAAGKVDKRGGNPSIEGAETNLPDEDRVIPFPTMGRAS